MREWQEAFDKYQRTPEYRHVNAGMALDEFKRIFWWEYVHRLLGRADRRRVPRAVPVVPAAPEDPAGLRAGRSPASSCSAALQGALGWYMVQSGLVDDPRVSQFRLTAHLGARVR